MFNIGASEVVVILIAALLILGPKRLPELARGIGKFLREFRRQTDEVRTMVEREFYRMDEEHESPGTAEGDAELKTDPDAQVEPSAAPLKLPPPEGVPLPAESLQKPEAPKENAAVDPSTPNPRAQAN